MNQIAEIQKRNPWISKIGEEIEQIIETHSAFVYLTKNYAFKIKKNVKFSFLDFSTVESRQETLNQELSLNRRLTTGVYLRVFPVYLNEGEWTENSQRNTYEKKEWVLQMRRLPESRMLSTMIQAGGIPNNAFEEISKKIKSFHDSHCLLKLSPEKMFKTTKENIQDNFQTLYNFFSQRDLKLQIALNYQIHEHQNRFLSEHQSEFKERVAKGYWVDGHGDLRLEHICLEKNNLQIFDCLEFNKNFRTLDRLDEACFLASELDDLDMEDEGSRFLRLYLNHDIDHFTRLWIAFFKSYRMIVRAKVAALSYLQHPNETVYLDRAKHCLGTAAKETKPFHFHPKLIILCGLSGSGKTYVSKLISKELATEHLQTDSLRSNDQNRYSENSRLQVYMEMLERCKSAIEANRSVICDGSFLLPEFRRPFLDWIRKCNIDFKYFELYCSEKTTASRISKRLSEKSKLRPEDNRELFSEADLEVFRGQQKQYCPPKEIYDHELLRINTDEGAEKAMEIILNTILQDRIERLL